MSGGGIRSSVLCPCVSAAQQLTLQSLVLLLHAQQQDLLVNGRPPQGPVVCAGPLGPLSGWQRPPQGVQRGGAGARRQRQELLAMTVVCKRATTNGQFGFWLIHNLCHCIYGLEQIQQSGDGKL